MCGRCSSFCLRSIGINVGGGIPRIYFNSESLQYHDEDLEIINLNHSETRAWGDRLLKCLAEIDDEFVLMMLEDFYYEDVIDTEIIDRCAEYMIADKAILSFQFLPSEDAIKNSKSTSYVQKYPGFAERNQFGYFKLSAIPSLWRKSGLMRYTNKSDSPWDWEYFGSLRTWLNGDKVYSWLSYDDCIFNYDAEHGGAIHRGKWVGYKTQELARKYNYNLNYGTREVEYDWIKEGNFFKVPPFYKRLKSICRNRSKFVFEILRGLWI